MCYDWYISVTIFPHIVSTLEQFPPLNSFRSKKSVYKVKIEILRQLFEFDTISKFKRIASEETNVCYKEKYTKRSSNTLLRLVYFSVKQTV